MFFSNLSFFESVSSLRRDKKLHFPILPLIFGKKLLLENTHHVLGFVDSICLLRGLIYLNKSMLINNDMYTIRISSKNKPDVYATAAIHAVNSYDEFMITVIPDCVVIEQCDLQKSGFKEDISIHVARDGSVSGIQYTSPVTALPRPCDASKVRNWRGFVVDLFVNSRQIPDAALPFTSRVRVVEPVSAQTIPTQVSICQT